jgi:ParB family chromosome partitioning protein
MARLKDLPGVKTNNLFAVPPAMLVEDEGFNIRQQDDDYEQSIEEYTALFLAGHRPPPLIIWKRDDELVLIDGHLRRRAALRAIERGAPADMTVDIVHFTGNDADRTAMMLRSGDKRKWTPLELTAGYKRLMGFYNDVGKVAAALGKQPGSVRDILALANADMSVQRLVSSGEVSPRAAITVVKKEGHRAAAVLQEAVDEVKASGGTRVSMKHVSEAKGLDGRTMRPALQRLVEDLRPQLDATGAGDFGKQTFTVQGATLRPILEALGIPV